MRSSQHTAAQMAAEQAELEADRQGRDEMSGWHGVLDS